MTKTKNKDLYNLRDISLVCDVDQGFYSALVWYHGKVVHRENIDSKETGIKAMLQWLEAEPEHQDSAKQLKLF